MKTITMLEVRRSPRMLVEQLSRGETFELTYRNRVVARIQPVLNEPRGGDKDPAYSLADGAEDLGAGLSAREADEILYRE
jgi:antitoxin (DNA-binding transcriptional repressor) of toxin-antitoxin stability system